MEVLIASIRQIAGQYFTASKADLLSRSQTSVGGGTETVGVVGAGEVSTGLEAVGAVAPSAISANALTEAVGSGAVGAVTTATDVPTDATACANGVFGVGGVSDVLYFTIMSSTIWKHRHSSCPSPMYAPRCAIPATRKRSSANGPPLLPGRILPAPVIVKLFIPACGEVLFKTC